MKKNINKRSKSLLIVLCTIMLTAALAILYMEIKMPHFSEEKVPVYKYTGKSDIQYNIYLKPNDLYDKPSVGEDVVLITSFVDNITPTFQYRFEGEDNAAISGDYEIVAVIEGYVSDEKSYKTIWKKQFTLAPKEGFSVLDKGISINKAVDIKLEDYNGYVTKLIEDSKVDTPVKLTVAMNVNLKANTSQGMIEEIASPSILIPLDTSYFEITEKQEDGKEKAIEKLVKQTVPPNRIKVISSSIASGLTLIILLYTLIFTKGISEDALTKSIKRILKSNYSRLVAVNSEIAASQESTKKLRSFEDLVKVADELSKPVMYKHEPDLKCIKEFFVFDNSTAYVFTIEGEKYNDDDRHENWRSKYRYNHVKPNVDKPIGANLKSNNGSISDKEL